MTQKIHGGLKMDFLHYNCFPAVTKKLIVGSHTACFKIQWKCCNRS